MSDHPAVRIKRRQDARKRVEKMIDETPPELREWIRNLERRLRIFERLLNDLEVSMITYRRFSAQGEPTIAGVTVKHWAGRDGEDTDGEQ